jgi:hypothetical protein
MEAVAAQGRYVYVGVGPRLQILDATDATAPRIVGQTEPLPGAIGALLVRDRYAYALAGGAGRVIDVSDPSAPRLVGSFGAPSASSLATDGHYLFVNPRQDLVILDIQDPASPREVGRYPNVDSFGENIWWMVASGGIVFVSVGDGTKVFRVTDPTRPELIAHFRPDLGYAALPFAVQGCYLLLTDIKRFDPRILRVVDIADPAAPREVGAAAFCPGYAAAADGRRHAYLVCESDTVEVVDVADPQQPRLVGLADLGAATGPGALAVQDGRAYVVGDSGLRVVVAADPAHPWAAGVFQPPLWADDVVMVGNTAYVLDSIPRRLWALDLTDLWRPVVVGVVPVAAPAPSGWLGTDGRYVYVAGNQLSGSDVGPGGTKGHISAYSLAPGLAEVGRMDLTGLPQDLVVANGLAYVTTMRGGLRIVDLDRPDQMREIGSVAPDPSETFESLAVEGTFAYIIGRDGPGYGWDRQLWVIDVSDPARPEVVGGAMELPIVYDLVVKGGYAYVAVDLYPSADGQIGSALLVIDVSDPTNPHQVSRWPMPNKYSVTVDISGDDLLASNVREGADAEVGLFDISDPTTPRVVAGLDTRYYRHGVTVGSRIYVAGANIGLYVMDKLE